MKINFISFLFLILSCQAAFAQTYFTRDEVFSLVHQSTSKNAISITDLDGDHLDDIQLIDKDNQLIVLYQRPDKSFEKTIVSNRVMEGEIFSILVADFDQNGLPDIIVNGATVPIMFYQDEEGIFRSDFADFESFLAQGSNAIDIDEDGLLDLFVCDDNAASRTYKNLGFTLERFEFLNMETSPPSDNSGNYGSIWLDIENDGDLDLYIAKCRAGVEDPTDPRRINALFINENGQFKEDAASFGLDIGLQSWSASAGDIDNDGDEDILITNHYAPSQVLVNNGTSFSIIELETEDLFPIQGIFSDLNMDGFQDILLSTISNEVAFINNQGLSFTLEADFQGTFDKGASICKGDLNNDGIEDLFSQNSGPSFDQVFYGRNPQNNHYLKVDLSSFTDINATNTTVRIYGPWGIQSRRVRAGESYGINNSKTAIFGLAKEDRVDSLKVLWSPEDSATFYDVGANQHIRITQEPCLETFIKLNEDVFVNCDSIVEIRLPDGYQSYEWSDGESGQVRQLRNGIYYAKLGKEDGCFDQIYPVQIKPYDPISEDVLIGASNTILCSNETVSLSSGIEGKYLWSTGASSRQIEVNNPGNYALTVEDVCNNTWQDTIRIAEGFIDAPSPISDTIQKGDPYTFEFNEDSILIRNNSMEYVNWGSSYDLGVADSSQSFFLSKVEWGEGQSDSLGLAEASTTFASNLINAGIVFDVFKTVFLKSVDVYTEVAGRRKFIIRNAAGKVTHSRQVDVVAGFSRIPLNFLILTGEDYILETEEEQNLRSFQSPGPLLSRSQNGVEDMVRFPYSINGAMELTSTTFGSSNYYFFYNWQVDHEFAFCESSRSLAEIIVRNPSNTKDKILEDVLRGYPNPGRDKLYLESSSDNVESLRIRNLQGQIVLEADFQNEISIEVLHSGTYILECLGDKLYHVQKFLKL